ncbi:grxC [Symbiodinium natans]|uniref:GrxC protein n=1 Tax=Symbiodinium natans TaxID=878477 RepID=A0A812TWP1_9DINO|nr:grxC [Symbiodinium natans]
MRTVVPEAGSRPSLGAFLRYAVTSTPKQDQSRNVPLNLAAAPGAPEPGPALGGSASELVALLRQVMLQLLEDFFDPASNDVDYVAMCASSQWSLFRALAAEIGEPRLRPELEALGEADRKAFFINLYNAMTFHGVTTFGRREGWWYLYCFFITPAVSYRVAGTQMSLDDIEHGILRARNGYFKDPEQELQRRLRMEAVDPRIHMALNCGAKGCPAVAVYTGGDNLDAELDSAVAGFVAADANVRVTQEASGIRLDLSEIFKMYLEDFVGAATGKDSERALARWLLPFASEDQRPLLSKAVEGAPIRLQWIPYDWATNGTEVPLDKYIYSVTF